MKVILNVRTVAKAAKVSDNLDIMAKSLMDSEPCNYSEKFKLFTKESSQKNIGRAFRIIHNKKEKQISLEVNPNFIDNVMDAAAITTEVMLTTVLPAVKVYAGRMEAIREQYGLKKKVEVVEVDDSYKIIEVDGQLYRKL